MDNILHHIVHEDYRPLQPIPADMKASLPEPGSFGKIKCVLFDIYGTLLISGAGEVGTAQDNNTDKNLETGLWLSDILESCGITVHKLSGTPLELHVKETLTILIKEEHRRLGKQGADFPEIDIREIWHRALDRLQDKGFLKMAPLPPSSSSPSPQNLEKLALRFEMAQNPTSLMPGFPEITQILRQKGYLSGIVSNAQFFTPIIVEALCKKKIAELGFEESLCCWSYKLGLAKPSPAIFQPALKNLKDRGIEPEEVLYLGNDMLNDVATAQQCGCKTALFAGDKRSLRLRENSPAGHCKPELIITNLNQLEEILP